LGFAIPDFEFFVELVDFEFVDELFMEELFVEYIFKEKEGLD
jgi:hypothetical protein